MDLTGNLQKAKYLNRKKTSIDGVTTIEYKLKPLLKKKVVVARGNKKLVGEHSIGAVITSQVLPFRSSMIAQLKSRGFNTTGMNWNNIVALYYNEFVSNKLNKQSPFVPINTYEFCNNLAFKIHPKDNLTGTLEDFRNAEGMGQIGNVIDNIVNTYKFALAKKRRAIMDGMKPSQVLSDVELRQAAAAERVKRVLERKLNDNYSVKQGTMKKVILWGVLIFALYYLLK